MPRWCRRFVGMVPHMLGPFLEMGLCCKWQSVASDPPTPSSLRGGACSENAGLRPEGFLFVGFAPKWGAKDEEALLLRRQRMVANPYGRLPRRRWKHFSKASVPLRARV